MNGQDTSVLVLILLILIFALSNALAYGPYKPIPYNDMVELNELCTANTGLKSVKFNLNLYGYNELIATCNNGAIFTHSLGKVKE